MLILFAVYFIYSCTDEIKGIKETETLAKSNVISQKMSARYSNIEPFATLGGQIELTTTQIQNVYDLVNLNDFNNLRGFVIYTTGNETGDTDVNIENLKAISLYHYKNGKLEHTFYEKQNNNFVNIPDLTAFCLGTTYAEIDFAIFKSEIYKNNSGLSTYSIINSVVYDTKPLNEFNNDYIFSNDLLEIRALTLGSLISLENQPSEEVKYAIARADAMATCHKGCGMMASGSCGQGMPNTCKGRGIDETIADPGNGSGGSSGSSCRFNYANLLLGSNYDSYFIKDFAYAISDLLEHTTFGMKYYEYYYNTSFHNCEMDYSDALKIALLLPKIYSLHDNFVKNNSESVVFDGTTKNDIFEIIESLKSKNSSNQKLILILNDVKNDVNFLTGKTIGELNEVLY